MKNTIGRNDPCPCGSGNKFKKCCQSKANKTAPVTWMEHDGMHVVAPGGPLTPAQLEEMTKAYQKNIRNSPLWDEMVRQYGKEKAKELLKEFRVKPG
jgi:hypothetical protein